MTMSRTASFVGMIALLLSSASALSAAQRPQAFAPDGSDPVARRCDLLAGPPSDPQRVGNGVEFAMIDVGQALPVCASAAQRPPVRPRYQYLYGRVLDAAKRYTEAVAQYAAADRGGYARASAALGMMVEAGSGVTRDPARAASLYMRAGDAGNADGYALAAGLYARSTPPDYSLAYSLAGRAARAGSDWGLVILGEFTFGGLGVTKNEATGLRLLRQAADRGNPAAMADLGLVYFTGMGVRQDKATALRWLTRAAELGIVQAQTIVGYMYEEGDGVTQSDLDAIAWYGKAAAQGDPFAMTHLGMLVDGVESVELFRKAAEMEFVPAYVQLGNTYEVGYSSIGLPRDPLQAAFWYGKAVEKGNSFAMTRLGQLYEKGEGVERNPERARQLYLQAGEAGAEYLRLLGPAASPSTGASASTSSGGFGDLLSPGIISPPAGYAPPPAPVADQSTTPEPPYRPLPAAPALSDNVKAALVIGAVIGGVAWLFSGSGSTDANQGSASIDPNDPSAWGRNSLGQPCMYGSATCH